jgi:prepilin-type N-terminal cleavage/methylation domain-containing protein
MRVQQTKKKMFGFTMVELMVVVTIISMLAGVLYLNFNDIRAESRDQVRQNTLLEMQLALEVYKAQYEVYPEAGCSATGWVGPGLLGTFGTQCNAYIVGLATDFISALPVDPIQDGTVERGYVYQVNSSRSAYKLMSYQTAETDLVTSYDHDFSRCPSNLGANCGSTPQTETYAVYSFGAEDF